MQQTLPVNTVASVVVPAQPHKAAWCGYWDSTRITGAALASGFLVNAAANNAISTWPAFLAYTKTHIIGFLIAQIAAPTWRAYTAAKAAKQAQQ